MSTVNDPPEDATPSAVFILTSLIAARLITKFIAAYALIQGFSIIAGGPGRFTASGYKVAMQVPWAPWSWGVALILCGATSVVGLVTHQSRINAAGVLGVAAWSMFFATAFAASAIAHPEANTTAMWSYGKDAFLFTILGLVKWRQPQLTKEGRPLWRWSKRGDER